MSTPVLARTTMHVGQPHRVIGGNHFVFISRTGFDSRVVFFDRFSRRFITMPQHPFDRFDRTLGFGGWGWGDWSGAWTDYGSTLASAEAPAGEFDVRTPTPPPSPAELPPCHETTSTGVVIERGIGCAH